MSEHTTTVLQYPQAGDMWSGECTCGWPGTTFWDTEEEARREADAHAATHGDGHTIPVDATLSATSGPGLLRAYAALTHRMHATETHSEEADYRAQRDLIEAEILRRMDGATS